MRRSRRKTGRHRDERAIRRGRFNEAPAEDGESGNDNWLLLIAFELGAVLMLMGAPRDWDRRGEALVVYAMLAFVPVAMILAGSREGRL